MGLGDAGAEQPPEPMPRLVHLRLRRSLGDPQRLCHLTVVQTLNVVQDERRAAARRQLGDGAFQVLVEYTLIETQTADTVILQFP